MQAKKERAREFVNKVKPEFKKFAGKDFISKKEKQLLEEDIVKQTSNPFALEALFDQLDDQVKEGETIKKFFDENKNNLLSAYKELGKEEFSNIFGDFLEKGNGLLNLIVEESATAEQEAKDNEAKLAAAKDLVLQRNKSIFDILNNFNRSILRSFKEFQIKGEIEAAAEKAANDFRTELENGFSKIIEPFTSKESVAAFQADLQKSQIGRDIKFKKGEISRKGIESGQGILESISKAIQQDLGGKGPIQEIEGAEEITGILALFKSGLEEANFEKAADGILKLEAAINRINSPFKEAGKSIGDVSENLRGVIRDTQARQEAADREHEERIKLLNLQTEIQKIILKNQKDIAFGGGLEASLDPTRRLQEISKIKSGIAFGGAAGDQFAKGRGFLELSKVLATFGQPGAFQAPLVATAKKGLDELINKFAPELENLVDTKEIARKQVEATLQPDKVQEDLRKLLKEYADKLGEAINKSPLIDSQDSLKIAIQSLDKTLAGKIGRLNELLTTNASLPSRRLLPTISGENLPDEKGPLPFPFGADEGLPLQNYPFPPDAPKGYYKKIGVGRPTRSPDSTPTLPQLGYDGNFPQIPLPGKPKGPQLPMLGFEDQSSVFGPKVGSPDFGFDSGLDLSSVFGPSEPLLGDPRISEPLLGNPGVTPGERMIGPSEAPEEYVIENLIKKRKAEDLAVTETKAAKKAADLAKAIDVIAERMEKVSNLIKAGEFGKAIDEELSAIDIDKAKTKKIETTLGEFTSTLGEFKVANLGLDVQGARDAADEASRQYQAGLITEAEYKNKLTAATSKLNTELAKINFSGGAIFAEELRQSIAATNEAKIRSGEFEVSDLTESIKGEFSYGIPDALKATDEAVRRSAASFRDGTTDALFEAIKGTKDLKSAFSDMFAAIADDLLKSGLRMAINSLFNSVGGQGGLLFKSRGGVVKGYSTGGTVTGGSGLRDDVPAYLSKGEYVVRKAAVDKYGLDYLNSLNSGGTIKRGEGGAAIFRGANEYLYDDPKRPTKGKLNVDERLSIAALTDEDNPQNRTRQEREERLHNYLADKAEHDRQQAEIQANFKKQKRARSIGALVNAGVSLGTMAISQRIGAYNQSRAQSTLNAKTKALRYFSRGEEYEGNPLHKARGGSINDDVPALLTSGEYVMRKDAVDKYGLNFFNRLNSGAAKGYAEGGLVGGNAPLAGAPVGNGGANNINITVNVSNNGTSATKAEGGGVNNKDAKALADSINNAVIKTIIDQKKPGGLLY